MSYFDTRFSAGHNSPLFSAHAIHASGTRNNRVRVSYLSRQGEIKISVEIEESKNMWSLFLLITQYVTMRLHESLVQGMLLSELPVERMSWPFVD